jgi:hypothetical protein
LLVSEERAVFATVESQISHETTGSVVHKDTLQTVLDTDLRPAENKTQR